MVNESWARVNYFQTRSLSIGILPLMWTTMPSVTEPSVVWIYCKLFVSILMTARLWITLLHDLKSSLEQGQYSLKFNINLMYYCLIVFFFKIGDRPFNANWLSILMRKLIWATTIFRVTRCNTNKQQLYLDARCQNFRT